MNRRPSSHRPWLLGILGLLVLPVTLLAANPVKNYTVAMIVFRYVPTQQQPPEQYLQPRSINKTGLFLNPIDKTIEPNAPYPAFTLREYMDFPLKDALLSLLQDADYQVILAFSWWQPFTYDDKPTVVNIVGGEQKNKLGLPLAESFSPSSLQAPSDIAQLRWEINGQLSLTLERYFELDLVMQYTQNLASTLQLSQQADFKPYYTFEIKQAIRAKSGKIYYFDHPKFGVIMMLQPYKAPIEVTDDNTEPQVTHDQ